MRIGMFTDTYTPQINGVVTSITSFAEELQKLGHEVFVFAPRLQNSPEKDNVFYFKSIKYAPMPEHHLAYSLSGHLKTFKDLNLDILHSHTPFSLGWLALFFAKQYNIPLVHTYHTLFMEYVHYLPTALGQKIGVWLSTNASRRYCHSCDLTIVPSEAMRQELQKYGVSSEIDVIPTGVNELFQKSGDPQDVLRRYNIAPEVDIIAYAGRIAREKNIEFLLHVYREILKVRTNILFAIIGDGPYRPLIEKMAADLNFPLEIIKGPIVREPDGLAMSSRNSYLDAEQRRQALALYKSLAAAKAAITAGEREAAAVRALILKTIEQSPQAVVDYIEISDARNLNEITFIDRPVLIALAVYFGKTRLIDNLVVEG